MGTAMYIGRVGALAVALGVGAAIANTPGVALADPSDSGSTSSPSASDSSSKPESSSTSSDSTSDSTGSTGSMSDSTSDSSGSASGSQGSTSTGDSQPTVGTQTSKQSTNETINETTATGEVAGESTTADTPAPVQAAPADQTVADATTTVPETPPEAPAAAESSLSGPVAASDSKQREFEQRAAGARGVDPVIRSTAVSAAPSQPDISQVVPAVVDVAVNQPAAPQAVTALTASTYPVLQTNLVATQALSAAPTEPTGSVVSGVVSGVLGLAGLGPLAPDSPPAPVDSPVGWAVVALVRSRWFGQAVAEEASNLPSSPTLTSQTIDGLVTGDLSAAGDQGDRRALADTSTMQMSAPVTVDAAATTTSTTTFAQVNATQQTQQSGRAPGGDTKAPTVSVTGPAAGATVSGTVTVSAAATDNVGVVGVQFLVDNPNTPLGAEDPSAPYGVSWDTTTVANGAHTLIATARDAAGNTKTATVNVTVANPDTTPPTVSITVPAPNATVSGTVTVSANASDNVGVVGVQFQVDGANLGGEDMSAPYSVSWNTVGNGSYTLTAVARDAAGNTATSAVTVTVANAPQTTIAVGTSPVDVAVTGVSGSRAYVSNYYDNTVSVIDTNTNTVIKTISVGASPYNLAASPDGTHVYVANQKANTVSVIDTNTNMVVDTIAVPVERPQPGIGRFSYVYDVAVSPDGRYVYVTGTAGSGFTSTDGTVSVIDTTTHAVSGPYAAGPAATGIAVSPDGSRLYVATELWNSNIMVMDTATMAVIGTVFVGESYYPIDGVFTPDGTRLYMITGVQGEAAQTNGPAVMVIDTDPRNVTTHNTVIAGFSDYDLFGGDFDAPSDVTFSPDGSRAYVVGTGGNKIAVIDTSTNAVVGHITTNLSQYNSSRHIAISPDGNTLYITDSAADSVVTVSVASMTATAL
jgi:YVTN family beta-propeller protein